MNLRKREIDGVAIVDIEGKLVGGPDCAEFHEAFRNVLDNSGKYVVINLTETPWGNSQGVGMLIGALTSVRKTGGELVLSNVPDRIKGILNVTRLNLIFKVFDDEEGAVSHLLDLQSEIDSGETALSF